MQGLVQELHAKRWHTSQVCTVEKVFLRVLLVTSLDLSGLAKLERSLSDPCQQTPLVVNASAMTTWTL